MMRHGSAFARAVTAALDSRQVPIKRHMLNSAGSVGAEWYVEVLWHYLAKQSLLSGVSGFDIEFKHPATPEDGQLQFSLPHPDADDVVMTFSVGPSPESMSGALTPVAHVSVHRVRRRRLLADVPDPPSHPYGIEVRERHLNSARQVSWHTLVTMLMDVARRGAQFADQAASELMDSTLRYVVPRFSFTSFADAAAQPNLFVYPQFSLVEPWAAGKSSMTAHVTIWAVAYEDPWPVASSVVTVVRTRQLQGVRRPVDERGTPVLRASRAPAGPAQ